MEVAAQQVTWVARNPACPRRHLRLPPNPGTASLPPTKVNSLLSMSAASADEHHLCKKLACHFRTQNWHDAFAHRVCRISYPPHACNLHNPFDEFCFHWWRNIPNDMTVSQTMSNKITIQKWNNKWRLLRILLPNENRKERVCHLSHGILMALNPIQLQAARRHTFIKIRIVDGWGCS